MAWTRTRTSRPRARTRWRTLARDAASFPAPPIRTWRPRTDGTHDGSTSTLRVNQRLRGHVCPRTCQGRSVSCICAAPMLSRPRGPIGRHVALGRSMTNTYPVSGMLRTATDPPWTCTAVCAMPRPRPKPRRMRAATSDAPDCPCRAHGPSAHAGRRASRAATRRRRARAVTETNRP